MNFRQRISWLIVLVYLAATCWIVYYIFEINDRYSESALEHNEQYHGENSDHGFSLFSLFDHLKDIPLALWLLLAVLPYIQIFAMLLACTKPQPQFSMAFLWPFYLFIKAYLWYQKNRKTRSDSIEKAVNSRRLNGHILIDT